MTADRARNVDVMTLDKGMKVPDIRAFCEVLSEEDILKDHEIGLKTITKLNIIEPLLDSFALKVFLLKNESSWMIISDCHGSTSDKTIIGYRPLLSKEFVLTSDLKKFLHLNFPWSSTMKLIDLPNDLKDGSFSVLASLEPLVLRHSFLKYDIFTKRDDLYSLIEKCVNTKELLHLPASNFLDAYSTATDERQVNFITLKTIEELAEEKLLLHEATEQLKQILVENYRNTSKLNGSTTQIDSNLEAPSLPPNFDSEQNIASASEQSGISENFRREMDYFASIRSKDRESDSDFEYPDLERKSRKRKMKIKSKASDNSNKKAKSKKSSIGAASFTRKIRRSTMKKKTNLPNLDSGSTDVPKTITLGSLDSLDDKDNFYTCTDVIKCPVFSNQHFHCIKCDKIFESRNLVIFHCKNSLTCKPHTIDLSPKTCKTLTSGQLISKTKATASQSVKQKPVSFDNRDARPKNVMTNTNISNVKISNIFHQPTEDCSDSDISFTMFKIGGNSSGIKVTPDVTIDPDDTIDPDVNTGPDVNTEIEPSTAVNIGSGANTGLCVNSNSNTDAGITKADAKASINLRTTENYITCWKTGENCKFVRSRQSVKTDGSKHYHCPVCIKYSTLNKTRIVHHYNRCRESEAFNESIDMCENKLLQCEIVDEENCVYLVRGAETGPGKPVSVQIHPKNMECSSLSCVQNVELAKKSRVNDHYCRHIRSCLEYHKCRDKTSGGETFDLFKTEFIHNNKDISDDDKKIINSMLLTKATTRSPLVRSFIPKSSKSSPSSIYLSVLYCGNEEKPYAPFGRLIVTYNVANQLMSCACTHNSTSSRCKHSIVGMLVINNHYPYVKADKSHISPDVLDRVDYEYKNKKIPFDIDRKVMFKPALMAKFTPHETTCHKTECQGNLIVSTKTKKGFLFTLENKSSGITIENKTCEKCGFIYRYQEWEDGWHNFNDSSIFSIRFLERILNSWVIGFSLSSMLTVLQQELPYELQYNFNEPLVRNAAKHYLALKEFQTVDELHCFECGYYPMVLVYDAIVNVCADLKPDEVDFDDSSRYTDFDNVRVDCCRADLLRGSVDGKKVTAKQIHEHGLKAFYSLPPCVVSRENKSEQPLKNTRNLSGRSKTYKKLFPHEEKLFNIDRIYSLTRAQLVELAKDFSVDTTGGRQQIIKGLINHPDLEFSEINKNFTKIAGKTGGLLRACCPHGVVYICKFLTLPEGVSDYTESLMSLIVKPTVNVSDISKLFSGHTNKFYPGTYRPNGGMPVDPTNEILVHAVHKEGKKIELDIRPLQAKFDISTYDPETSVHPMSGILDVLGLDDRMHHKNHKDKYCFLRCIDIIQNFAAKHNTEIVEQLNSKLKRQGFFLSEMNFGTHINVILYKTMKSNREYSRKFKLKAEKSFPGSEFHLNSKGCYVTGNLEDHCSSLFGNRLNTDGIAPHDNVKALLQSPSYDNVIFTKLSWFNSMMYMLYFTPLVSPILDGIHALKHTYQRAVMLLNDQYVLKDHVDICRRLLKELSDANTNPGADTSGYNIETDQDIIEFFRNCLVPNVLDPCAIMYGTCKVQNSINMSIDTAVKQYVSSRWDLNRNYADFVFVINETSTENTDTNTRVTCTTNGLLIDYICHCFIAKTESGGCETFVSHSDPYYQLNNDTLSVRTVGFFVAHLKSARLIMYKLKTDVAQNREQVGAPTQCRNQNKRNPSVQSGDISDFNFTKKDHITVRRDKQKKIYVDQTILVNDAIMNNMWLNQNENGRISLSTNQKDILNKNTSKYDDVIINCFMSMIGSKYNCCWQTVRYHELAYYEPYEVNDRFVQVVHCSGDHWVVLSNKLSSTPDVIEVFDSGLSSYLAATVFIQELSASDLVLCAVLQLMPTATKIQYLSAQNQLIQKNGCGPLAILNFWCLTQGNYPTHYGFVHEYELRNKLKRFAVNGVFEELVKSTKSVTSSKKKVHRAYEMNTKNDKFRKIR